MDLAAEAAELRVEVQALQEQCKEAADEIEALKRILHDTEQAANNIREKNVKLLERLKKLEQRQDVIAPS